MGGGAARQKEEHLILEFRDGVRVYVPASKIDLVQKYVGGGKTDPELSKLGGTGWQHRKDKVQAAVLDLASEMIQLQALRESQPGFAFPPDSDWQAEFEASFPVPGDAGPADVAWPRSRRTCRSRGRWTG